MTVEQEINAVFSLLKEHLKAKKISYAELAKKLNMSESNVKRIFSSRACTLQQVAHICAAAETSFVDLVAIAGKRMSPEFLLPVETEDFFISDFDAFIFYRNLFAAENPQDFIARSSFPNEQINAYLKKFENFRLIKRKGKSVEVVGNGYLNLSKTPMLRRLLQNKWARWFMNKVLGQSESPNYYFNMTSTGLSKVHRVQLIDDLERVLQRYRDIGFQDQAIGAGDFESVGLCIGIGPHRIGFFEDGKMSLPNGRY